MEEKKLSCVDCGIYNCRARNKTYPDFCLTTGADDEFIRQTLELYMLPENNKVSRMSAEVEADNYCQMTRIEEIAEFAGKMGYKKLGIATCVGLAKEAHMAARILRAKGFEVYGVICKVGAIPKTTIGIAERCEKLGVSMCNPIMQARLLNREKTDLNVVIGLCVGHDSLFYKYSEALCTTLVTKDRVLAHNPCAALYQAEAYYKKLLKDEQK